ncbi:MAG: hypothetical protein Q9227_007457 [Pyrenula ochraceoflavens]
MPTPEENSPAAPTPSVSSRKRVLACVLCQQRKVKCDRKFPCANCVKADAQCVPAAPLPRQRRRRFPERELLDKLRHYEGLLRENNIEFEPVHVPAAEKVSSNANGKGRNSSHDANSGVRATGLDEPTGEKTTIKSEPVYEAKNIWLAMNQKSQAPNDSDDDEDSDSSANGMPETVVKRALDELYENNDYLLFGSRSNAVDLSALHPGQVQIFKLWQIYLENVNPLLKVTHTPTLQARIIDAAGDVASISAELEALMFSMYSITILSLDDDECRNLFGLPTKDLLTSYQFGCQQALLNCGYLRTSDRDCLTALFFFLISVRPDTDPRSLAPMVAVAVCIAQRMGIHNESTNAKCTVLEAEMRRRLWWALILFDSRLTEMSASKSQTLAPTWDCRVPLNISDFDLRPEMKTPPTVLGRTSEAIFAVVRCEMGDFVRHCGFYLDFTNPALKSIAKNVHQNTILEGSEMVKLRRDIEDKYLKVCDPENPLHFMTIWTARHFLMKNHLLEYYSQSSDAPVRQTDAKRDAGVAFAIGWLECDTKLMTSPITKGFRWLVEFQFPFPAYIHLVQDLRRRPARQHVKKSWEVMSASYEARAMAEDPSENPFFEVFSKIILQAWAARETLFKERNEPEPIPPTIVLDIKQKAAAFASNEQGIAVAEQLFNGIMGTNGDEFDMPMPTAFGSHDPLPDLGAKQGALNKGNEELPETTVQTEMEIDVNQLDWGALDWNPMSGLGW